MKEWCALQVGSLGTPTPEFLGCGPLAQWLATVAPIEKVEGSIPEVDRGLAAAIEGLLHEPQVGPPWRSG